VLTLQQILRPVMASLDVLVAGQAALGLIDAPAPGSVRACIWQLAAGGAFAHPA
jgi:hypothetical protein